MRMSRRFMLAAGFVCLFAFVVSAEAQSRLVFPRVLSIQELATTGFALVNTSPGSADATFTFYSAAGQLVTTKVLTVPGKGQIAKLGSEIVSGASSGGWVLVTSSGSELQGFELIGDFATVVDGAGPTPESTQLAVIAFSNADVLNLVSTSSQPGTAQITVNSASGAVLGTRSVPLTPFQATALRLSDLNSDNGVDLVSLSADVNIAASVTTKLPNGRDVAVTNATNPATASSTFYFPFAPNGPQGSSNWKTLIAISNVSSTAQTVSMTFTPDNGAPTTFQTSIAPRATATDSVASLFRLPNTYTPGWIQVTGSAGLLGVAAYQDSANGSLATVPSQSAGATRFLFGHIASLPPWYTGLALLNTTTSLAQVELSAVDPSGQLIGAPASFFVQPNSRVTAVLSEFAPQVLQRISDGGFVFLRSLNDVPLLGFELFGHATAPILANVQGFALPGVSSYTPPAGNAGPLGITVTGLSFTDGTSNKTQFQPRDTIVHLVTINNTNAETVPAQVGFQVTDPRGQAMVSFVIPASLTPGASSAFVTGFIPSNALTGQYSVTVAVSARGQIVSRTAQFNVTNGTANPNVTQETPSAGSTGNVAQFAFRPGDTARFLILTSNFTNQPAQAAFNYSLTGPGALNAGSGSVTITVPTGLTSRSIDVPIPASAPIGLYAFSSAMVMGATTATKGTVITVAPASKTESADLDLVFVSDSDKIPRAGFTPGSTILLNTSRLSSFATTQPATIRYTVTDANSATVFDQPVSVSLLSGRTTGTVTVTSGPTPPGVYTFRGTLSYLDNSNQAQTASLSTSFTLANTPPSASPEISARAPYVADINFVARTAFSPGETLVLVRTVYSTYPTPVTGTVRYLLTAPASGSTFIDSTVNVTFNPGVNTSFIAVTSSATVPRDTYNFTVTAAAQGQTSTSSPTSFVFAGPTAPSTTFSLTSQDRSSSQGIFQIDVPVEETEFKNLTEDRIPRR
jgi:hypothetical protein